MERQKLLHYQYLYVTFLEYNTGLVEKFYVKLLYRNLADSSLWKEVYASVSSEQFILEDNDVSVLRSITGIYFSLSVSFSEFSLLQNIGLISLTLI